ncbi:MAG: TlpA family protein disulfide reductase [Thermodesulfobacteriota bacterium]
MPFPPSSANILFPFFRPAFWLGLSLAILTAPVGFARAVEIQTIDAEGFDRLIRDGAAPLTIVSFMTAWCGPCRAELPNLIQIQRKFERDGLRLLGLSLDEKADALRPILKKADANFPVYWAGRKPVEKYGIQGIPLLYFIQGDQIVDRKVGLHSVKELEKRVRTLLPNVPSEPPPSEDPASEKPPLPPGTFSP